MRNEKSNRTEKNIMVTLKSAKLTVEICETGAEIQSVKSIGGTEFIWCGDENIWSGHAPILFPICGNLKNDTYEYNGKEYSLPIHGFASTSKFFIEYNDDTKAIFLLKSDEKTLSCYPFEFEFRAIFELDGNELKVTYNLQNKTDGEMLFAVGAHEAYSCPEGIEEYDVIFEKYETLNSHFVDENLISNNTVPILENKNILPLKKKTFEAGALIFFELISRKVTLKQRNGSRKIEISFPDHDFFLIWTKPEGDYICLEPCCGIGDIIGSDYNFSNKKGIHKLNKSEEYNAVHTIKFSE